MSDFQLLQNKKTKKWVSLSPRRAKRPDVAQDVIATCPFCSGRENDEPDVFRIGGERQDAGWPASNASQSDAGWQVRVIPNKFPFAPIHEIIIHSQDHHKNFGELPVDQVLLILKAYQARYNTHKDAGQVYIFHNRGEMAGESLPHPHTQLVVLPYEIKLETPPLDREEFEHAEKESMPLFSLFCPETSQWPDEVWIVPNKEGKIFGQITDEELIELSGMLTTLIQIMDARHGHEFPFNFYIYPGKDWYLRFIPRHKTLGGFEIGTGVYVNTQDPKETIAFIKQHYLNPNFEVIAKEHRATYGKHV